MPLGQSMIVRPTRGDLDRRASGRRRATAALAAGSAVAAAAGIGSAGSDPASRWYRRLRKPPWQPPPAAFPLVWTPLYGAIAWAGARGLARAAPGDRARLAGVFLADLALNAAWTPLFFRAQRLRPALAELACLDLANLWLIREMWRADRAAALLLVPYTAWSVFATALNAEIARLNPRA